MKKSTLLILVLSCYTFLLIAEMLSAQIKWTDWREIDGQPNMAYRIAFAKQDESNRLYGYYVEFKNKNLSRVKFAFELNKSGGGSDKESSVMLKPNMQSQVGIHYTDIAVDSEVVVKVKSVRLEE